MTLDFRLMPRVAPGLPGDSSLLTAQLARRGRRELDHEWFAPLDNGLVRAVPSPVVSPGDQLDRRLTDAREIPSRRTQCANALRRNDLRDSASAGYEEDDADGAGFVVMSPDPVACDRLTSLAW